jgi:hypothetical protein
MGTKPCSYTQRQKTCALYEKFGKTTSHNLYNRNQIHVSVIVMHGAKNCAFYEKFGKTTSHNLYNRNQIHVSVIVMHGAKNCAFYEKFGKTTSHNLYCAYFVVSYYIFTSINHIFIIIKFESE